MSLPNLSGVGRLTNDVELKFSSGGMAIATIQLAFNSRKLNRQTNEWEDDAVFYVRATAFKQLAENAAETLARGMEVNVSGRLKTEQWTDKQSGDKRSATSLLLDSIGPNLAYATAQVVKSGGGNGGGSARSGGGAQTEDPWSSASASSADTSEEPPF